MSLINIDKCNEMECNICYERCKSFVLCDKCLYRSCNKCRHLITECPQCRVKWEKEVTIKNKKMVNFKNPIMLELLKKELDSYELRREVYDPLNESSCEAYRILIRRRNDAIEEVKKFEKQNTERINRRNYLIEQINIIQG